jgi:hypothetical protein
MPELLAHNSHCNSSFGLSCETVPNNHEHGNDKSYWVLFYMPTQMTMITTSNPLFSPSYLKLHMPSVFSFQ